MPSNRFEEMEYERRRQAEREMVFAALHDRRSSVARRRLLTALLWVFGIR